MLLPNQWLLRPAGTALEPGDFPVNLALSPDGRFAAILHCGYSQHEVILVNLEEKKVVGRASLAESFYGITFSSDGRKLFCSGASAEVIHVFDADKGTLSPAGNIRLRPAEEQGVPAGLAVDSAGRTLYAANLWSSRVSSINLKTKSVHDIVLTTNAGPVRAMPEPPAEDADTAAANKRARAIRLALENDPGAQFPYACALDENHDRLFVSLWGDATVAVVDLKTETVAARWKVGEHPCELGLAPGREISLCCQCERQHGHGVRYEIRACG